MYLLAGIIIMGGLARLGTGSSDLLLKDDHDALLFDGVACCCMFPPQGNCDDTS